MIKISEKLAETIECINAGINTATAIGIELEISQGNASCRIATLHRNELVKRVGDITGGARHRVTYARTSKQYEINGVLKSVARIEYPAMDFFCFRAA